MIRMTPLTALASANSCFRASNVNSEPLCCAWGIKITPAQFVFTSLKISIIKLQHATMSQMCQELYHGTC